MWLPDVTAGTMMVDGTWSRGAGKAFPSTDPATGDLLAEVTDGPPTTPVGRSTPPWPRSRRGRAGPPTSGPGYWPRLTD